MANDRMYLVHPRSQKKVFLGREFMGWRHTLSPEILVRELNEFFAEVGDWRVPVSEFRLISENEKEVMPDEKHFLNIVEGMNSLKLAVKNAKQAGLCVYLLSDDHGITITARVSREYCTPEEKEKTND